MVDKTFSFERCYGKWSTSYQESYLSTKTDHRQLLNLLQDIYCTLQKAEQQTNLMKNVGICWEVKAYIQHQEQLTNNTRNEPDLVLKIYIAFINSLQTLNFSDIMLF